MRTRATLGGILASAAVLVIGWQLGSSAASVPGSAGSGATSGTASAGTLKDGTYDGAVEQTRFGNVQVQIVVASGSITDVKALQLTDQGGRSVQISNYAAPILRAEVLKAQSTNVSSVSGATYTTQGYLQSLQSAIDKAKA